MTLIFGEGDARYRYRWRYRFAWVRRRRGGTWVCVDGDWLECLNDYANLPALGATGGYDRYERYSHGQLVEWGRPDGLAPGRRP